MHMFIGDMKAGKYKGGSNEDGTVVIVVYLCMSVAKTLCRDRTWNKEDNP